MSVERLLLKSREEWLKARRNHIGGSDASACVGMNPYKDNVQLWEEKTGLVLPDDISGRDYVLYGTQAEEHLRALFAMDFPEYQVSYHENNMFLNTDYPWMHASLDGELTDREGRRGILEIKTTNILQSMQKEKWRERIPDNYFCQVLHYLAYGRSVGSRYLFRCRPYLRRIEPARTLSERSCEWNRSSVYQLR